ncbi:hypothetical protein ACSNOK_24425 [Streptomyces sp. URMC 126]|uniref:hypothetical protein n=1 Tax=Streptomyces sp. URMC 126 TaxID=3423401 RepID=UPI003F1B7BA1
MIWVLLAVLLYWFVVAAVWALPALIAPGSRRWGLVVCPLHLLAFPVMPWLLERRYDVPFREGVAFAVPGAIVSVIRLIVELTGTHGRSGREEGRGGE